jgi:hypothetical protein
MYKYISNLSLYMEQVARVRVRMFGTSFYLNLPAMLCQIMEIEKGAVMRVYRDGDKIIFEREKPTCQDITTK